MNIKLTKRQAEILDWVQKAQSNKAIAKRLGISEATVKLHIGSLFKKYGVQTRVQLAMYSTQNVSVNLLTIDKEEQPVAWVHLHGEIVKGIIFTKTCPNDKWIPLYKKASK